jgi:hypothetical protein
LIVFVALAVIGVAGLFFRLSMGPVSLGFLQGRIEQAINNQLPGISISLGEPVIELDTEGLVPRVHTRNLVLKDQEGVVLASSPRAGVALDGFELLTGKVVVNSLELIGPHVNARRNVDGGFELGIGEEAAPADEVIVVSESDLQQGTDSATPQPPKGGPSQGTKLLEALAGNQGGKLARIDDIRVTRASVRFYDEANDATWTSEQTDLSFRRTGYGFVVVGKSKVASGGEPWNIELSASFKREANAFSVTATISDLVPADVAEKVYALSQFAKLKMPFSGHLEMALSSTGQLTRADGELVAAAGVINLPDFLAKPILVDEGTFRMSYLASDDVIRIIDSSILIGGSRAEVSGAFSPQRDPAGKLTSFGIDLLARNISVDAQGTIKDPVDVDRIEFKGNASVEEQKVDIDDLVVMAGNTGVRLRGAVVGGDDSPGIQIAGRLRDVSVDLLKKLWPPILTPRTRAWINDNVDQGRISDGTFQINFVPNALAQMQREKIIPAGSVELAFNMSDVTSRYFKAMPALRGASGNAHLKDDDFILTIDKGEASLDDGRTLQLASGRFEATALLSGAAPGDFKFDIVGPIDSMMGFAALPDLKLATSAIDQAPKLKGNARLQLGLAFPLIKGVTKDQMKITTALSLDGVSLPDAAPGIDLTEGSFKVDLTPTLMTVSGPAKLNGANSQIVWKKPRTGGKATTHIETVVNDKMREHLGLHLSDYMAGDVPVSVDVVDGEKGAKTLTVDADLSDVNMKLSAARWARAKAKGTKVHFSVKPLESGGKLIDDFALKGPGIDAEGSLKIAKDNTLQSVTLTSVQLNDDEPFSATLVQGQGVASLDVKGGTFDARPYISNLVKPAVGQAESDAPKGQNFSVKAAFKTVIAHRGEVVRDVSAQLETRKGTITSAAVDGTYASGFPLAIRLTPVDGGRQLQVNSPDGGSTLRATNFYSKIAGGSLEFKATIANEPGSPIRGGQLTLRRFDVRNEATLAQLDQRGRPKKSGPRVDGVQFKRLVLPFSTDAQFVRMCNVTLEGPDLGGQAEGLIRKKDGAIDITGTMIPAQGLNGFLDDVPLFDQLFAGGKGGGIFGVTFAMGGTISAPKTQVNPLSVFAPGILREMFKYRGTCAPRGGVGKQNRALQQAPQEPVTTGQTDQSGQPY